MANYARLASTATRLIKANGVPITLSKPRADDYDPTLGSADARQPATFLGFGVRDEFGVGNIDGPAQNGSLIRTGLVKVYATLDANADPQPGDGLTINGDRNWLVDSAMSIAPGPVLLLYEIKAKRP